MQETDNDIDQLYGFHQWGPTTSRPTDVEVGTCYFDTDIERPIWFTGEKWVDGMGGGSIPRGLFYFTNDIVTGSTYAITTAEDAAGSIPISITTVEQSIVWRYTPAEAFKISINNVYNPFLQITNLTESNSYLFNWKYEAVLADTSRILIFDADQPAITGRTSTYVNGSHNAITDADNVVYSELTLTYKANIGTTSANIQVGQTSNPSVIYRNADILEATNVLTEARNVLETQEQFNVHVEDQLNALPDEKLISTQDLPSLNLLSGATQKEVNAAQDLLNANHEQRLDNAEAQLAGNQLTFAAIYGYYNFI